MKSKILIFTLIILNLSCQTRFQKPDYLGGWCLGEDWFGYMGVAYDIKKDNTFNYWFYTDVVSGEEITYPIKGTYKIHKNRIMFESEHSLYSNEWVLHTYKKKVVLIPLKQWNKMISNQKFDETRFLYSVKNFDQKEPFSFQNPHKIQPFYEEPEDDFFKQIDKFYTKPKEYDFSHLKLEK